ncbi:Speract receptor [Stylophora pistillata]|uniref:Speract receptor n=1 Tax=Stylophora pistillata TaxID=50429 RepID=A0A2B4RKN1_STYPI|nr:Speract receptor [Stylophora pistillata]
MARTSSSVTKPVYCIMAQGQSIMKYGFVMSPISDGRVDQEESLLVIQSVVSPEKIVTRERRKQAETSSDSCIVVSGLPERNGNKHAGEIASMALRLVVNLKTFKISHMQGTTLQFRIGIHIGPCVAGVVGLKKPRYDIFGETVDITRQMEETATAHRIHVSSMCKSVLDELGGFRMEDRGLSNIKAIHRGLVPRRADKAVQQINRYPADKGYQNLLHYPPDIDLSSV